jgi:hypothetical protein
MLSASMATIGGPVMDWIAGRFSKRDEAHQAERFAKRIGEKVAGDLLPMFQAEHGPGLNEEAVALALGDTLDRHVDARFLVAHDLEPARLIPALFELRPLSQLEAEAYGEANLGLYERALPALIERLVPEAKQFKGYEVANAAEVLKRLRELAEREQRIEAAVGRLDRAHTTWERRRSAAWRSFEEAYRDAVLDRWNKLELFGIDVSEEVQGRQKLSIAYIQLNLQSGEGEDETSRIASAEELLENAAREGRPLVILGEAGGGKTTLLRWAACTAVDRMLMADAASPFLTRRSDQPVPGAGAEPVREREETLAWWARAPFLLRLREVKGGEVPGEDEWPRKSSGLIRPRPDGWLDEVLGAGHGLILLDGLDELGSEGREVARDMLRSILRDRRGNLVVLTSRPGAFEPAWFEEVPLEVATIRAMSPDQRDACVANWHEAVVQAKPERPAEEIRKIRALGEKLAREIRTSSHLREPTTNPLICAATCALHYGREGYLPSGLVDLFDALIKMLVHDRDAQQGLVAQAHVPEAYRQLDLGPKRQLLEEIAVGMILGRQRQRSRTDTLPYVADRLASLPRHSEAKPEEILDGLLLRSSLLRPAGEDGVDFLHNSFMEYLAATRFVARRDHAYLIREADRDPGDRVFVYAYAIASERGDDHLTSILIDGLLAQEVPACELMRHRQLVGLRCKAVTIGAAPALGERFDWLIEDVLPPRDNDEAEAVAALGDGIVPRLVHPDAPAGVAAPCVHALVTIGTQATGTL